MWVEVHSSVNFLRVDLQCPGITLLCYFGHIGVLFQLKFLLRFSRICFVKPQSLLVCGKVFQKLELGDFVTFSEEKGDKFSLVQKSS